MFSIELISSSVAVSLLWRASWQAAVLFAVVLIFVALMRRWIAARYRVVLWCLPLVRLFVLVVPVSGLSLFHATDALFSKPQATQTSTLTQAQETADVFGSAGRTLASDTVRPSLRSDFTARSALPPIADESLTTSGWNLWSIALAIWSVGAMLMLGRWLFAFIRLRAIIRQCHPIEQVRDMESLFAQHHIRSRRRIRVLVTDQDLGPATAGVLRPVILVPRRLAESLNDEQFQAVIRHESQHIDRYDTVLLGLCRLASTIHWFNPLVYVNASIIRRQIELAVDAATIAGLDDVQRQSYGRLLLHLASSPNNHLGLAQMASQRSKIRSRIEAITKPQRTDWLRSTVAFIAIGTLMVTGLSDRAQTQDKRDAASEPSESNAEAYHVVGQVVDKVTGEPVAGAKVQFLVDTEQDPEKRVRKGKTDEQGRYRIEVPMGEVKLWFPELKPGHWLPAAEAMVSVTTSPEQAEATLNIDAHSGAVWRVQAIGDAGDTPILSSMEESDAEKRAALLRGDPVQWEVSPPQAFSYLDEDGFGALTQVGASGGLFVGVVNVNGEIVADAGFDNTSVVTLNLLSDTNETQLIDSNGRKATVKGAEVSLSDGVPLLTFQLKPIAPARSQKLMGRVVGPNGSTVAGARVGVASGIKNQGSSVWPGETETDQDGRFKLDVSIPGQFTTSDTERVIQFAATINQNGFASRDTEYINADADFSAIDFGSIQLTAGYSMPVIVVDAAGKPVPGASVEPQSDYALRREAARTDTTGKAILKNLPAGLVQVIVRYGEKISSSRLVVSDDPQRNTSATIRISKLETGDTASVERPKPVPVGATAPELSIRDWSDGKPRKLSDYRGKVVVLDFWGVWCGPCIQAIPAMQSLAEKYEPRGVVFLGVHTADGDASQINKLMEVERWKTPSGVDTGSSIADGQTCLAYGIRGYPSVVIVDAQGKIAFNSSIEPESREAVMKEMANLAKKNDIPWPPNERSNEEMEETMTRLQIAMFSREIDREIELEGSDRPTIQGDAQTRIE